LNAKRIFFLSIIFLFINGNINNLLCQESESNPEEGIIITETEEIQTENLEIVSAWDFIRMILILVCVIGAIYIFFYFLKKGTAKRSNEYDIIKELDYKSLANNRGVHLIEVGNSLYLIGSSENTVSLISEVKDRESVDQIRLEVSRRPERKQKSFQDIITNIFNPGGVKGNKNSSVNDSLNFMENQKKRLKKLR
jgi:flagellar protein FliO/FliZ